MARHPPTTTDRLFVCRGFKTQTVCAAWFAVRLRSAVRVQAYLTNNLPASIPSRSGNLRDFFTGKHPHRGTSSPLWRLAVFGYAGSVNAARARSSRALSTQIHGLCRRRPRTTRPLWRRCTRPHPRPGPHRAPIPAGLARPALAGDARRTHRLLCTFGEPSLARAPGPRRVGESDAAAERGQHRVRASLKYTRECTAVY
jgi:hypothetical protein